MASISAAMAALRGMMMRTNGIIGGLASGLRCQVRAFSSARPVLSDASLAEKFPPHVLNAPATEVSTLSNGVRVASEGGHGETATVGIFVDAGSRYENASNNGVAHFLEHMIFKGTKSRTRAQLEEKIENMGGHLNAYTSREHTVYFAKVFKQDVSSAVEILSDILQNSEFSTSAVEEERGVILREMEEVEKNKDEVVFDKLHETAYPEAGLGRTILGPRENIQKMQAEDLRSYIKTHYTGPRVVVSGAGAVDHEELAGLADKHFGALPGHDAADGALVTAPTDPAHFVGSEIRVRDDAQVSTHVAVGFETGGWTDAHSFPLQVMQQLLGSWDESQGTGTRMASGLCRRLAEGNFAQSVSSFNVSYKDTGLFGVFWKAPPTQQWMCGYHVMHEVARLAYEVNEEELARGKAQLKAKLLMQLDGSTEVFEDIGRQMLTYGRRMTPAEVFARVDAVSLDSLQKAASAVVTDHDLVLSAVGNHHELPDYNWFRRRTNHMRM